MFYGWIAMVGVALVYFIADGTFFYSYGVFIPTMCSELGWSRTTMASGFSLGILAFGLPSLLIAASISRFGPRLNIIIGNLLAAIALAGMSIVEEAWHLYVCYGLVGLGAGFGLFIACTTVVNNWFIKKRSLGMGIIIAAGGLGGLTFPPFVTWLIITIGWQMSWIVLGSIQFIFAVLIGGIILIRNRPEDVGQITDGVPIVIEGGIDRRIRAYQSPIDWHTKQAMKNPVTLLIIAVCAANNFAIGIVTAHQIAFLKDMGFSSMIAATVLSIASGISILGRLGFGALAVRFEVRQLATISFAVQIAALTILLISRTLASIYVFAVLFGISYGALIVAFPTFVGAYYGRAYYAPILSVIFTVGIIFEATGPVLAGIIYDVTNTYIPAYALVTIFSLVGLVSATLARPTR